MICEICFKQSSRISFEYLMDLKKMISDVFSICPNCIEKIKNNEIKLKFGVYSNG